MKKSLRAIVVMPIAAFLVGVFASALASPTKTRVAGTTFYVQTAGGTQTLSILQTIPTTGWQKTTVSPQDSCIGTLHTCFVIAAENIVTGAEQVEIRIAGTYH
ncbi:MAG: hypothetical protein P4L51_28500 [Puia sp.]|nr:hypothetical protein [Puia sp.]